MVSFNILGDCVSRDIITSASGLFGGVKVLQYHSLSSPMSIVSEKGDIEIRSEDFTGRNRNLKNFRKRCRIQDINKTALDYIFQKKSDYFILDILDARFPLLKKKDYYFTKDANVNWDEMPEHLELSAYNEVSPFIDITMEQWKSCTNKLTNAIQEHYRPNQIILNIHYGVAEYTDSSTLRKFGPSTLDYVNNYNSLVYDLFELLKKNLEGCHIIEFPEYVIADKSHWLGLTPLHYHDSYYEYAAKAIKVILNNVSDVEERNEIESLRRAYSERFELIQAKMKLNATKRMSESRNRALMYVKSLAFDFYGDGNFTNWLLKNQGKKVAVLKNEDVAGQILIKGLDKYGFDVIFSTRHTNFDCLTEAQMSLCKEADIVISANVHSKALPQSDGIKVINIYDILREDKNVER